MKDANDALGTYLHDHLAGAAFAVEMLQAVREQHANEELGGFAAGVLLEIEDDRSVLQQIAKRVESHSSAIKEAASWFAEKASRLKLRRQGADSLGTFETLETLALGIRGKEALWNALRVASANDPRLQGVDYPALIARAQEQHAKVEAWRIDIARTLFAPAATSVGA
jgi:hypothetical protein